MEQLGLGKQRRRRCACRKMVPRALGVDTDGVLDEWTAHKFTTSSGVKIDVKSAAFMQSRPQKKPSSITFKVRATCAWDLETNLQSSGVKRQVDQASALVKNPSDVVGFELLVSLKA